MFLSEADEVALKDHGNVRKCKQSFEYLRNVLQEKSQAATVPSQAPANRREESGASAHTRSGLRRGCSNVAHTSPVSERHTMTDPSVEQLKTKVPHALKRQQWTP